VFVLNDYIFNFYNALNINEVPLSAISNPLSQFILCESGNELNEQVVSVLGSKYVGNDLYYLTGGFFDFSRVNVNLDFQTGNNFFYWFSGEYVREIPEGVYSDLSLSSIDWSAATGSPNVSSSDIMFISVGNKVIEGAWLVDTDTINVAATMSATMKNDRIFKFPYPSVGVSAENIQWSGPMIEDLSIFSREFFPNEKSFIDNQVNVENLYWSNYSSISSVNGVYLNDTTLHASGAFDSNSFTKADKIYVRRNTGTDNLHDIVPSQIFNGTYDAAWLYSFPHTELPIRSGDISLYYPLSSYGDINELFFRYDSGDSTPLSTINVGSAFAGAIAGNIISNSDMLFKLTSPCGTVKEAAWLKGIPLSSYTAGITDVCDCSEQYNSYYTNWLYGQGVIQASLSFTSNPGQSVRFVWTGPRTNINDVRGFTGFSHDESCPYYQDRNYQPLTVRNFIDLAKKQQYEKWKTCTCKTVNYSPLGHSKDSMNFYGFTPDVVLRDTKYPADFKFDSWIGNDGRLYNESVDAAWFKLSDELEPDLGWGQGSWITNTNDIFYLNPGETYIYYRSDIATCDFALPLFVINEAYCECVLDDCPHTNCIPVWWKAVHDDENNIWIDGGRPSDMILESDTFMTYTHRDNMMFSKTILTYQGNIINSISGDWVTLSAVDFNIGTKENITTTPAINFLMKIPLINNNPYWAEASFENNPDTALKLKMVGVADFRTDFDYLRIRQPYISNIFLQNNDVIEYKMSDCNDCFVWGQPLNFTVQNQLRRWNKILVNSNVKSDLLNYLQGQQCTPCDITGINCLELGCYLSGVNIECEAVCYPLKTGLSATNLPSDILLNTELSGIPVFVDYYARNPFSISFSMIERSGGVPPYGGIWVPPISTIFTQAELPWHNIINDFYPIVASEQTNSLSSINEIGIFTPNKLMNGKYELKQGIFDIDYLERDAISHNLVRGETYADGDTIVTSVNSEWMKWKGNNRFSGNPKLNGRQTFYPYTSKYELSKFNNLGLYDLNNFIYSPWNEDGSWADSTNYPANNRGQFAITCGNDAWYNQNQIITLNVVDWGTDIFGNQYFLLNSTSTKFQNSAAYSHLYVKDSSSKIYTANTFLSALFRKYQNITFGVSGGTFTGDVITDEAGDIITTEDGSFIVIG
jgi:hypothetical protein